jgi:hypothetical protein
VLSLIGKTISLIADAIGEVLKIISEAISAVTRFIGLGGGIAPAFAGAGSGGGGGHYDTYTTPIGGGRGGNGVSIGQVNIQSPPISEQATTRIAAELRSPLAQAIQRQHSEFESSMKAAAARGNL